MSGIEQFESILRELPTLKAPGISGSRIKKLAEIAIQNVDQESQIVSKLYASCKSAPSTHKLGTIYVVDNLVRRYRDEAKSRNQSIDSSAPEGTFAAGAFQIGELIESLVDDALNLIINPSEKEKISKLVDIWEKSRTFDSSIIGSIRSKHFASTTPKSSPPKPTPPATGSQDPSSILQSLASISQASTSNSGTPVPDTNGVNALSQLAQLQQQSSNPSYASISPPQAQVQTGQQQSDNILEMLKQMQANSAIPSMAQQPRQMGGNMIASSPEQLYQKRPVNARDRERDNRDRDRGRRDDGAAFGRRNRSRSPGRGMGRRERSPGRELPPPGHVVGEMNVPGTAHYRARPVSYDNSLPSGSFKVFSRTLFIGGVPHHMDEKELAQVLRPYAEVQSVILNNERKHAFVKVYSRPEAEQVINNFNKSGALGLRTRWGVGFGPRDCCDYQHGVSIIPISRLTDADRLWTVQAQWGGTGGKPLVEGICIEEPDIEIGNGVSSKAISKKMPTNSARNGPKSNKPGEPDENYVKTTLTSNNDQPSFMQMSGAANPLAGLFGNNNSNPVPMGYQQQQQQQQPPQIPQMPQLQQMPQDATSLMQSLAANPALMALLQQQQQQQR